MLSSGKQWYGSAKYFIAFAAFTWGCVVKRQRNTKQTATENWETICRFSPFSVDIITLDFGWWKHAKFDFFMTLKSANVTIKVKNTAIYVRLHTYRTNHKLFFFSFNFSFLPFPCWRLRWTSLRWNLWCCCTARGWRLGKLSAGSIGMDKWMLSR